MRISTQMMYAGYTADIQSNLEAYYKDQEQISSGQKLNRNSDDPAAIYTIISGKSQLIAFEGYQDAITNATTLLDTTDTALDSLTDLIASAKELALNTSSDSAESDAEIMNNLMLGVIGIANTQVDGRYIFSGYASDEAAVDATTGMYLGTSDRVSMTINSGVDIDVNIAGDELIAYGAADATSEGSALMTTASSDLGLITESDDITSSDTVYSTNGGTLNISLGGGAVSSVTIPAGATLAEVGAAINTVSGTTGVTATVVDANNGVSPADYKIMLSVASPSTADDISVNVTTTDDDDTGLNRLADSSMDSVYSVSGGTLDISLDGGAATAVTIPAGATWADVTAAINASGTGVRAEAINANATGSPADYRMVLSATPDSAAADISVDVTTTDAAGTGLNRLDYNTTSTTTMTSVVNPDTTIIGAMSILKTAIEMKDDSAVQTALTCLEDLSTATLEKQSEIGVRQNRIEMESDYITSRDLDVTNAVADKLTLTDAELAKLVVAAQQKQTSIEALRSLSASFLQLSIFDYIS
jgi:flagellar hook-associated protein 3 FlgL